MNALIANPLVPTAGDVVMYGVSALAPILAVVALFDLLRVSHISSRNKILIALAIILLPIAAPVAWLFMRWKTSTR
ncbi:PLDc N-terminal domain-containing protein [uncultured Brevibacterium sp.]|uniref:PLDc N-terminal domain-containing protein n=1 Tax=uncultured Brevibacterium sp. TaxID=189678 RepID=UPI0025E81802|nr:PLDc N-terminal domain-containing protein [uncultured Brevibacterium sp.]